MLTNSYIAKKTHSAPAFKWIAAGIMIFGAIGFSYSQENTLPDNGNVGIGTTTPSARLQVSGSAKIDSSLVVNDSLHVKNTLTVTNDARMGADLKVDGDLILPSLITPDTYPSHLTFLYRDANAIVREGRYEDEDVTDVLKNLFTAPPVGASQPGFNYCSGSYTAHPTWYNGTNKIYEPCPDVKVGLGTDAPAYTLDNRGNAKTGGHAWFATTASVGADNNSFARFLVHNPSSGAALQLDNVGNSNQFAKLIYATFTEPTTEVFNVKNTALNYSPFLLNANGAMTIANNQGTTFKLEESGKLTLFSGGTQTFRVETNGTIRARHAKIDLDTWADYVFEPTYRLRPLAEVETYVNTEKHLPGIPSEKELIDEGMDVTEMNRLLMEKVEELTLYLIEQSRKDAQLQTEIDALKAEITELQKNK